MNDTRTHFSFRVDLWDEPGVNVIEHVAGVKYYEVALATFQAACRRWPAARITLRQGTRILEDSRMTGFG
jgi:hypothetical protein